MTCETQRDREGRAAPSAVAGGGEIARGPIETIRTCQGASTESRRRITSPPDTSRDGRARSRSDRSIDRQSGAGKAGADPDAGDRPRRFGRAACFVRAAGARIRLQEARAHVRIVRAHKRCHLDCLNVRPPGQLVCGRVAMFNVQCSMALFLPPALSRSAQSASPGSRSPCLHEPRARSLCLFSISQPRRPPIPSILRPK